MYHCKVMIVDELVVLVGSTNFDDRSFHLNDEANLNIYDAGFAKEQAAVFDADPARSRRVTLAEWQARRGTRRRSSRPRRGSARSCERMRPSPGPPGAHRERCGKIAAMDDGYGIPAPEAHHADPRRAPARYLVLILSGGDAIAKLFRATHELAAELDAATEEVAEMTNGLTPTRTALNAEWDLALAGHSAAERAAAEVYTLDV